MKNPIDILFAHWKAWADATHSVNATRRDLKETGLAEVVIPAMEEYARLSFRAGMAEAAGKAVDIYSNYAHSAEVVVGEDGKKYMELRLRWQLPAKETPDGLVLSIVNETEKP